MTPILTRLNAPQISRDRKDTLIHFACTSVAILLGCATVGLWMWIFNASAAAFYDAATFTSPLGG